MKYKVPKFFVCPETGKKVSSMVCQVNRSINDHPCLECEVFAHPTRKKRVFKIKKK